eukprot:6130106-Pleurochrysis_carterae.AAC.4
MTAHRAGRRLQHGRILKSTSTPVARPLTHAQTRAKRCHDLRRSTQRSARESPVDERRQAPKLLRELQGLAAEESARQKRRECCQLSQTKPLPGPWQGHHATLVRGSEENSVYRSETVHLPCFEYNTRSEDLLERLQCTNGAVNKIPAPPLPCSSSGPPQRLQHHQSPWESHHRQQSGWHTMGVPVRNKAARAMPDPELQMCRDILTVVVGAMGLSQSDSYDHFAQLLYAQQGVLQHRPDCFAQPP